MWRRKPDVAIFDLWFFYNLIRAPKLLACRGLMSVKPLLGRTSVKNSLAFILIMFLTAQAKSLELRPADIMNGEKPLSSFLKAPSGIKSTVLVKCFATISASGNFADLTCLRGDISTRNFRKYERAIQGAAKKSKAIPAAINGEEVEVKLNLSIVFSNEDGEATAAVVQNHLYMYDLYGMDYIGPQRYGYSDKVFGCVRLGAQARPKDYLVWVKVTIDEKGNPSNVKLVDGSHEVSCLTEIVALFENSSYIPAIYKGKTVSSEYRYLTIVSY